MTDILLQLRREFSHLGLSVESERAVYDLRARRSDLALDGAGNLCDVLRILEPASGRTPAERGAIMAAMLQAAGEPLWRRALLQTLLPGLVSLCRSLRFGEGIIDEPSECLHVAIVSLDEIIARWAGQERPFAGPDLLSATRSKVRRYLLQEKSVQSSLAPESDVATSTPSRRLELDLLDLQRGDHAEQADLVYAAVFGEVSVKRLAQERHMSPERLRRELQNFSWQFLL